MNAYEPFPSEVLTGTRILRGAQVINYLYENKGKTNGNGLDPKLSQWAVEPLDSEAQHSRCQTLSSKVAHYTEPALQK
jgi:hypothetical protein